MTSFQLPTYASPAQSWQLSDQLDRTATTGPAAPDGVVTVALQQLDSVTFWQLSHMVISCTSTTATQLRLYLDTVGAGTLRDGSNVGNFDVADWPSGLYVPPSRSLIAQWTGASQGAVGTLTVQGQVYRMTGS